MTRIGKPSKHRANALVAQHCKTPIPNVVFDKGTNAVSAAGADVLVGVQVGVPITPSVGWLNAVGGGTGQH